MGYRFVWHFKILRAESKSKVSIRYLTKRTNRGNLSMLRQRAIRPPHAGGLGGAGVESFAAVGAPLIHQPLPSEGRRVTGAPHCTDNRYTCTQRDVAIENK
ncbi:hypothetical protein EVAR_17481_1 [Eumeta japonica]|uniref:Uncharacterized protein n=1 Tax=Eumeta variegata TaxID=151549 RepID=A0A4C1ZFM5_EUMVA|nr:hypothetical protein EVAR_17481_1 [Eumeta japonica]